MATLTHEWCILRVPEGGAPGDNITFEISNEGKFSLLIPPNAKAGSILLITVPVTSTSKVPLRRPTEVRLQKQPSKTETTSKFQDERASATDPPSTESQQAECSKKEASNRAEQAQAVLDAEDDYALLSLSGVTVDATSPLARLKRAHRKLSLRVDPEKLPEHAELAKSAQQALQAAYDAAVAVLDAAAARAAAKIDAERAAQRGTVDEVLDAVDRLRATHTGDYKDEGAKMVEELLDAAVKRVRATHRTPADKHGNDKLTRDGAILVLRLRAPGRIVVDVKSNFWSCCLVEQSWSTDDTRWGRLVFDLRADLEVWGEEAGSLQSYYLKDRYYYDPTFHEKLDQTLASGLLPFRNGRLLDLSTNGPGMRDLSPYDYVSLTGTIDRDLPDSDAVRDLWTDDGRLAELRRMLAKNFSDEPSRKQVPCLHLCPPLLRSEEKDDEQPSKRARLASVGDQ